MASLVYDYCYLRGWVHPQFNFHQSKVSSLKHTQKRYYCIVRIQSFLLSKTRLCNSYLR